MILTYKKVWLHQVNCSVPALPSSGRLIKEALMWLAEDFEGKGGRSGRNIGRKRTGLAMSRLRLTHTRKLSNWVWSQFRLTRIQSGSTRVNWLWKRCRNLKKMSLKSCGTIGEIEEFFCLYL
ncbi:unnamed protein product [Brassica rapa]|uniref:Uncharacterized protein n=2 Tax=Brassica TaxID=3705 RepID=A0A8D9M1L5_BRACM|nr:unnamed protein product [Brassica napus]CAG7894432.1 unnamed protein product [Brassica rapa]